MMRKLILLGIGLAVKDAIGAIPPPGESSITALDILRSRLLLRQPKMVVPTLNGSGNFDFFPPSRSGQGSMQSCMYSSQPLIETRTLRLGLRRATVFL